jgi:hypothetical protein
MRLPAVYWLSSCRRFGDVVVATVTNAYNNEHTYRHELEISTTATWRTS